VDCQTHGGRLAACGVAPATCRRCRLIAGRIAGATRRNTFARFAVDCDRMLYRFEEIEKSYGPHDVLRGVTWQHNPGEHVGLVGRNGAGKTTLFRLLLRQEEPDHGQIIRASNLSIGHVGQHLDAEPGMSLFDYVETAFANVLEIERKMRTIEHDLADAARPDHERLLEKYSELQHD